MKIWKYIIIGFFTWCVVSTFFAYDFMSKVDPEKYLGNSFFTSSNEKSKTESVKVDGVEYLVVETNNGVGVTLKLNKSNLRKLAEMVSEISDEMDAEKFNNIIQGK